MPQLPPDLEIGIRIHLGYDHPQGVTDVAEFRFQKAIANIRTDEDIWRNPGGIQWWIRICDAYLVATNPFDGQCFSQRQIILGDVNRSTTTVDNRNVEYWWGLYLNQCDKLAKKLVVANLQRPDMSRYIWARDGAAVVVAPEGPPDSCVSDRIYFAENWS